MFSSLLVKKSKYELSLAFEEAGIHLAVKNNKNNAELQLFFIESEPNTREQKLKAFIEEHGYQNSTCKISLSQEDYILIQTEKPSVPDEEVNEAIKWKLGDLIPWDVTEITVDNYVSPEGGYSQSDMVNVVVARDSFLQRYVDLCLATKLNLEAIEIPELSLARFFPVDDNAVSTLAVIQFYEHKGIINLYHEQVLYLTRKIEFGESIFSGSEPDLAEQGYYERIALDLQRSLDYFESTYNLGGINSVFILPEGEKTYHFQEYLKLNLSLQVKTLSELSTDWGELFEKINVGSRAVALSAISGLLEIKV